MSKNSLFEAIKEDNNVTTTANGMTANVSTLSDVLDLFTQGATYRNNAYGLETQVLKAYNEDKLSTIRTLFYFRDIRGNSGQGERTVFRNGMRALIKADETTIAKVLKHIPFYGRWDDLLTLWGISSITNDVIKEIVITQLMADQSALASGEYSKVSLLAKWMPSINTSSPKTRALAKTICKDMLGQTPRNYRKMLSNLRGALHIIERYISKKKYTFDYSKIPGAAMKKYSKAFARNDAERWGEYLKKLHAVTTIKYQQQGFQCLSTTVDSLVPMSAEDFGYTEEDLKGIKANTQNLYPYEIVEKVWNMVHGYFNINDTDSEQLSMYDSMWKNQKNYFGGDSANQNWLAVADVSGSMYGRPIQVAISLAMYIAEHNHGLFKDKYMTYSANPQLVEIDRNWDLYTKVKMIANKDIGYNTDLIKVFDTVLKAAVRKHIPQSEMPASIVIISDMQFDAYQMTNTDGRSISIIKEKYEKAGYTMPKIVYWNVAEDNYGNTPITVNDRGVVMVNGCKPGMFEQILQGIGPVDFMLSIINDARYQQITI